MENLKEKTITSFFWKLLERGGNQIVSLIVQIIMARLLTPNDFGLLAILLVIVNIGNILSQSGLGSALVQSSRVSKLDFSTVFWISISTSSMLYLIVFFLAPFIATFYNAPVLEETLRVIALIMPISALSSVLSAFSQRDLNFKKIFKATISATFISGFAGVTAAIIGAGLWSLILQQLIYALTNCIVLFLQTSWRPSLDFSKKIGLKHFRFGWKMLVSTLLETGYDSLSDLLVGRQFGTEKLGFLSQGKKYPVALDSIIGGSIQPVFFAAISRSQNDINAVKNITQRTLKTAFYFVAPIMIFFVLTAEPIVSLILGEQWLPAVPFMQMYCFTSALASFHSTNYQTYNGLGRSDLFLKTKLITVTYGTILLLIACFILQDIYAVTIAYMVSSAISTIVYSFPNRKLINYTYFQQIRDIALPIILAIFAAFIAYFITFINLPNIFTIITQWLVATSIYLLLSKLFRVEEFNYLLNTLNELISKLKAK